uniref:preprotein translocase subunit G n=1 Tax=Glaucosphaera vacuolata TaxID=38265 RepID=UPI001FCCF8C7|nr:preprotein translocase subunit G [Glaucosphaera vacuolata]UNJ18712.1 preprotein translocase subunit G [Glaucosphaera vacuolata]
MIYILQRLWYIITLLLILFILLQNPTKDKILSNQEKFLQKWTWILVFSFLLCSLLLSLKP